MTHAGHVITSNYIAETNLEPLFLCISGLISDNASGLFASSPLPRSGLHSAPDPETHPPAVCQLRDEIHALPPT